MMSMDAVHVHVEEGGEHGKVGATLSLRQMTTYERHMKTNVMPNPPCTK